MDHRQYTSIIEAILTAAAGDPSIMTGLPPVDLTNQQLRFTRAIEICKKVEALIERDEDLEEDDHYQWYRNLGVDNVVDELAKYRAQALLSEKKSK